MFFRRLCLAAALLLLISGIFVFWSYQLTAEEQAYVGTWHFRLSCDPWSLKFAADHRCIRHCPGGDPAGSTGLWWVRNGTIYLDFEPNPLRRAFRPLLVRLGLPAISEGFVDKAEFETLFVRAGSD